MYLWRQWRNGPNRFKELRRRGVPKFHAAVAAGSPTGFWRMSGHPALQQALRNTYFDGLGMNMEAPLLAALEQAITDAGVVITRLADLGGAHGYSQPGRITILETLTPADSAAVLVHEFAHELLHQRGDDRPASKTVRETEAEAVAFIVGTAIGIRPSVDATDYIQLYDGNADTLRQSLHRIQATAKTILSALPRERANHVVGFVSLQREDGHPVRLEYLAYALHAGVEVVLKLLGQLFSRRLVGRIPLVAKAQPTVVHPAEVLGLVRGREPLEKIHYAPRGGGVLAARSRQGT